MSKQPPGKPLLWMDVWVKDCEKFNGCVSRSEYHFHARRYCQKLEWQGEIHLAPEPAVSGWGREAPELTLSNWIRLRSGG